MGGQISSTSAPTSPAGDIITIVDLDNAPLRVVQATGATDEGSTKSKLFECTIDARNNPGEEVYVRFINTAAYDFEASSPAAPTVGTDDAEMVLPCNAGRKMTWTFPSGIMVAETSGDATEHIDTYVACVKDAGGSGGSTSPSGQVDVYLWMNVTTA
jgi:hypothetical protein